MGKKGGFRKIAYRAMAVLLAVCIFKLAAGDAGAGQSTAGLVTEWAEEKMLSLWCPALVFAGDTGEDGLWMATAGPFPVLAFFHKEKEIRLQSESAGTWEEIIRAEGQDEYTGKSGDGDLKTPEASDGRIRLESPDAARLQEENAQARQEESSEETGTEEGAPQGGLSENELSQAELPKAADYQWEFYEKYDALVKEFYAVDASTAIDSGQLNLKALLGKDLSIQKRSDEKPQILIYHTHSQEGFADSVEGDADTTIMGVGEVLTRILQEQYGYSVLHHLGQYDVENRDYAYNNSLPALEKLLADNPGIEVVIDLHRDEVAGDKKLVTQIDGKPTAMFMFFNGLSRTKKHGDIEYLPNENLEDNLAFSFQMQALCNEYYPGLTRRIYLKGYRYNMHLKPRYLLIEMGGQNNTYEECYNACIPLAQMLDMELSGADFGFTP